LAIDTQVALLRKLSPTFGRIGLFAVSGEGGRGGERGGVGGEITNHHIGIPWTLPQTPHAPLMRFTKIMSG
jgi:hypothetical protein